MPKNVFQFEVSGKAIKKKSDFDVKYRIRLKIGNDPIAIRDISLENVRQNNIDMAENIKNNLEEMTIASPSHINFGS